MLLLLPELYFVRNMLPLAAAARAEMLAERHHPLRRKRMETNGLGFPKVLFLLGDAQVHYIAGSHRAINENDDFAVAGQALALGGNVADGDLFEYRMGLVFPFAHVAAKIRNAPLGK